MKVRADIAALLRDGLTDRAIARQLGCDRGTVARARERLSIGPAAQPRPANRSQLTLEEKWRTLTRPADGGHLEWTGRIAANGTPVFKHHEKDHSAFRVAFTVRTGREPVGYAKPACDRPLCVEPSHVDDTATRNRDRAALAAITGRWHRQETHCRRGHAYAEHGRHLPDGSRYCNACVTDRKQQRKVAA